MGKVERLKLVALLIIPLIGIFTVFYATRFAIGISPDSTFYICAAEFLVDHGELRTMYEGSKMEYLTHYPPGLSVILAGINLVVNDIYEAARWSNALFLFALLFSVGFVLRNKVTLISILLIQSLLLFNLSVFQIFEMVWSEPPYLFYSFIAIYALYRFATENKFEMKWLILSAVVIAMATVTRYVGVTLILASTVIIWNATQNQTISKRLKYIVIHGFISVSLLALWMIRNFLLVDKPTDRHFEFHPMGREYYEQLFATTTEFFIPIGMPLTAKLVLGIMIFVLLFVFAIMIWRKKKRTLESMWLLYAFIYIAFLIFSNTFLEYTPFYFRTMSPVYMLILLALLVTLFSYKKIKPLFTIGAVALLLLMHLRLFAYHVKNINGGWDLSAPKMLLPETIDAINTIPADAKIFSNAVDRLYYMTKGRSSDWLQSWTNAETGIYYDVLFAGGYDYTDYFNSTSDISWEIIYESDDVLIRKHVP